MRNTLEGVLLETKRLAKDTTRKLAIENLQQEFTRNLDKLTFGMHNNSRIPCFVVAPRASGRTSLAYRYTQQYRQGDDVHWLDGSTDSFVQGIEAGTLANFIMKRKLSDAGEQVLVVDDLIYLEPWLAERFSDDIDALIEQGWQVIVITLPQYDCYENLQSDRYLITGADLLGENICTRAQQLGCLAQFLVDALPLEIRLFATLTVILNDLTVEEANALGFSMHDDLPQLVAALNPLFKFDKLEPIRLVLKGMPLLQLMPSIKPVFLEYYQASDSHIRPDKVIETLTRLSMELLNRGMYARSHEVLGCIETLFSDDSNHAGGLNHAEGLNHADESNYAGGLNHATDRADDSNQYRYRAAETKSRQAELHIAHAVIQQLGSAEAIMRKRNKEQEPLYIRLFGDLEVYHGAVRVEHRYLKGRRIQNLLALIMVSPRKCITRDLAVQQFWPRMDFDRAVNNFHVACSRLSKALTEEAEESSFRYLLRSGTLYHFDTSLVTCDIDYFDELAQKVILRDLGMTERIDAVRKMESLYRDELLAGNRLEGVLEQHRKRELGLLVDALLVAARLHNDIGDVQAALWFTRRAYDYDHSREDIYRALMDAQLKAGQRTLAIETYFACKDFLYKELGILPSLKTTTLYQDLILNQG